MLMDWYPARKHLGFEQLFTPADYEAWLAGQPGKKKVLKKLYGEIIRDVRPVEASRQKSESGCRQARRLSSLDFSHVIGELFKRVI